MSELLRRRMAEMRHAFEATMPSRLECAVGLLHGEPTRDAIAELHRLLHEVSGNAGMLGSREVYPFLRAALETVETVDADQRCPNGAETTEIAGQLQAAIDHLGGPMPLPGSARA